MWMRCRPVKGTPCSFWLAHCLVLTGRRAEGQALFERLLDLRDDLGLLAEEYGTAERLGSSAIFRRP